MIYHVKVTATAEVEETWLVEAENEEAARAVADEGELHLHTFVSDKTLGEERDRQVSSITPYAELAQQTGSDQIN